MTGGSQDKGKFSLQGFTFGNYDNVNMIFGNDNNSGHITGSGAGNQGTGGTRPVTGTGTADNNGGAKPDAGDGNTGGPKPPKPGTYFIGFGRLEYVRGTWDYTTWGNDQARILQQSANFTVRGRFSVSGIPPGNRYRVAIQMMLTRDAFGWYKSVIARSLYFLDQKPAYDYGSPAPIDFNTIEKEQWYEVDMGEISKRGPNDVVEFTFWSTPQASNTSPIVAVGGLMIKGAIVRIS